MEKLKKDFLKYKEQKTERIGKLKQKNIWNDFTKVSLGFVDRKKIIIAGIGVVAVGFFVLSKADSFGQNWAAMLSPFLILSGYTLIGIGIVSPDKKQETPSS